MVIILKLLGGYIGIVSVQVIWKVFESIMNNRIQSFINLNDALHSFRQGRGVGTATMEAKLDPKVVGLCNEPLFQDFLYMHKSYESLDRGRCMDILRGYGLRTNL